MNSGSKKKDLAADLFGSSSDSCRIGRSFFTPEELSRISERRIGTGLIGGKAAGFLLANKIALKQEKFIDVLNGSGSFFLGTGLFIEFIRLNDLMGHFLRLSEQEEIRREEYNEIRAAFLAGRFPASAVASFRDLLDSCKEYPLILRPSSLLESQHPVHFPGKYPFRFCMVEADPASRLDAFVRSVKEIYAGVLSPEVLRYRSRLGLREKPEEMAVLVQRVNGRVFGSYFFPALSGTALSRNPYCWTDRINPKQGVIRLVLGLGTRAVNLSGEDYPRMIAVSQPLLRPEIGREQVKYSQRRMDLLSMTGEILTMPVEEILDEEMRSEMHLYASILKEGCLLDPPGRLLGDLTGAPVLTFHNLIRRTSFVRDLGEMLETLEKAFGAPVETEFTAEVSADRKIAVQLVQCRTLRYPTLPAGFVPPKDIAPERVLFKGEKVITGGVVSGIRFILYVDPTEYDRIRSPELKGSVGRIVGRLNALPLLRDNRFLVMGPGRWGSSNPNLGVHVAWGEIDHASALVEIASGPEGHLSEVSLGTHFFLDLVQNRTICLSVRRHAPECGFREDFFHNSPSVFKTLLPNVQGLDQVVRLIDLSHFTRGTSAEPGADLIADPESGEAICFLKI